MYQNKKLKTSNLNEITPKNNILIKSHKIRSKVSFDFNPNFENSSYSNKSCIRTIKKKGDNSESRSINYDKS